MNRIKDIDVRITEIEKVREAEEAREYRILDEVRNAYEEQEKTSLAPMDSILKKLKLEPKEIEDFFRVQENEAKKRLETAVPKLQLNKEELEVFRKEIHAIGVIDPCSMTLSTWKCQHVASSGYCSHWETANALGSFEPCTLAADNNQMNLKVEAHGQGTTGWRSAQVNCYLYFYIPARPQPAMVDVYVRVYLHGFYVLQSAAFGSAQFTLSMKAQGYQYGVFWPGVTSTFINLSGNTMGRYDEVQTLHFKMPVGANDQFIVQVHTTMTANAKKGGSFAVGDFKTGNGNYINVLWVNTYSNP